MASLYIGDLHPDITEAMLFEKFSMAGPVLSIRVCRNTTTQRSLGYAYINFQKSADAEHVLNTMNHDAINGCSIRIMRYEPDPSNRKSGVGNVFIENLDQSIDNKALYDTFSAFGHILSCKIVSDENGSKGYGFVNFETEEAARNAIEKGNDMSLNGKKVFVCQCMSRKERNEQMGDKLTKFTNVFIKNFGDDLDENDLREMFENYGSLDSVKVMTDETGISKGFGFVSFEDTECAEKAVEELNGKEIGGRPLYVGRAQKKMERQMEIVNKTQSANLFVKNLAHAIDDERLLKEFSQFGTITSAKVMTDEESGRSKGFGFVCFNSPEEATKAVMEMDGRVILSKMIYVGLAQRKEYRKAHLTSEYNQHLSNLRPRAPQQQECIKQPSYFTNQIQGMRPNPRWPSNVRQPGQTTANSLKASGLYVDSEPKKIDRQTELRDRFERSKMDRMRINQGDSSDDDSSDDDSSDDEQLWEEFSQFGTNNSTKEMTDVDSRRSKSPEEATQRMTKLQVLALEYKQRISRFQSEDQVSQQQAPQWSNNERQPVQPTTSFQPLPGASQIRAPRPTTGAQSVLPRSAMISTEPRIPVSTGPITGRPTFTTIPAPVTGRPTFTTIPAPVTGRPTFTTIPAPMTRPPIFTTITAPVTGRSTFMTIPAPVTGRHTTTIPPPVLGPIFTTFHPPVLGRPNYKFTTQIRNPAAAQSAMAQVMQQPHVVVVQGQEPLTPSMLAQVPLQEQKQMLGERLFPLIQQMHMELAGKITGILLEIDNSELLHMLESNESLKGKVEEAVSVLQAHQAKEGTGVPADKKLMTQIRNPIAPLSTMAPIKQQPHHQAVDVQGQEPLTPSMLAQTPLQEQKQMLGERLFPLIQQMHMELAGKITGMLLEIDNSELLHMLASNKSLKGKVEEAVSVLQAHQAKEVSGTSGPAKKKLTTQIHNPIKQQPHQQAVNMQSQEPLTVSMLAQTPLQEQKQMLGERLFPLIQQMHMELAGKITGMLLEIDNSELLHMLESNKHLKAKVEEAVSVLQAH